MFGWLRKILAPGEKHRPEPQPEPEPDPHGGYPYEDIAEIYLPYRIFTTAHDRVIPNSGIDEVIAEHPDSRFDAPDYGAFHERATQCCAAVLDRLSAQEAPGSADLAVTLLLDHSGSTRGDKNCALAASAGIFSKLLTSLNVRHEVLGYTTLSWRGGASCREWLKAGQPPLPGRICDLLHIVHRPFGESEPLSFAAQERMTKPALLKENVDGEALLWAGERLLAEPAKRRLLIVLSEGAPVDDQTLIANEGAILSNHLRDVIVKIVDAEDIELYAIAIDKWGAETYPQYVWLNDISDLPQLLALLHLILATPVFAPTSNQVLHLAPTQY